MNIIVFGGAGFAGSGIVKSRLDSGDKVTVVDIVSPLMAYNLHGYIDHKNLNYLWKASCDVTLSDFDGIETVVYLAAQADVPMGHTSPRWTVRENIDEMIHVLEIVKDAPIKKFIYAGSGNEFGRPVYLPIDEKHPLTPHNPYSFSKAAAEMACWTYWRCYGVPVTIMSNGACLGSGMRRDIFIYRWLRNMRKGLPVIIEGGSQTRDLTYVTDIQDAWKLVIDAPATVVNGEKFQVSYAEELSVTDILAMCYDVTKSDVPTIQKPFRPGEDGQREAFTNAKARKLLGYNPHVAPREGIELTWEWIKSLPIEKI